MTKDQAGNMILHIPHSSKTIPRHVLGTFVIAKSELKAELVRMTDSFTDILFPESYARVVFPVSRLVVDPERFADDSREPMSKKGMGVVYTKTSHGFPLRKSLSSLERDFLLSEYYFPHHRRLTDAVDSALSTEWECLVVDCHSFPSSPLPYETDRERPDICIGNDPPQPGPCQTPVTLRGIRDHA